MDGITMQPHLAGHAGVCEIILDRPEVLNAIDTAMATRLAQACAELASESDSRVVVLSAAGDRAFCVGADLKERSRLSDAGLLAQREVFRAAFAGVLALPQPVIAAVHGYALGGGCELALCADFRVAGESAKLGQPEITLGIIPGAGGTQRLPKVVGRSRARELIFSGRIVPAEEALAIGLVDRLEPDPHAAAVEQAARLTRGPTLALAAAKEALNAADLGDLRTGLGVERDVFVGLFDTRDQEEGMRAFLEKRDPTFEGR
jgi:enoyl-CoA hydratase/carnithine racemase